LPTNFKTDRVPPQAIEIEQSILASCLFGAAGDVVELLKPDHFYRTAHQTIFSEVANMVKAKEPVDLLSITQRLRDADVISEIGGASYVSRLADTPQAIDIEHYADKIKDTYLRRQIIIKCNELSGQAYQSANAIEIIDNAQRDFLSMESTEQIGLTNYGELAERMVEVWEAKQKSRGMTGVPSGFSYLDLMLGGFQSTDLIVIAARPGMGKTAFALNITEHAASKGFPVLFISLEMSAEQLYQRQTSKTAKIDSQRLRLGRIENSDWPKITDAQSKLYSLPVYIDDKPRQHYKQIVRTARRAVKAHGIRMVVIDYLQLVRADQQARKDLEIGDITGEFKAMAKELQIPVVLLSQLNREVERRDNKRPRQSDLKESSSIEQDADVIMFLYRHEKYYPGEHPGIAELNVDKHRNGPTGLVKLSWIGWRTSFENLAT